VMPAAAADAPRAYAAARPVGPASC
jgi:hypothetical protein